jgi:hypothetical protein
MPRGPKYDPFLLKDDTSDSEAEIFSGDEKKNFQYGTTSDEDDTLSVISDTENHDYEGYNYVEENTDEVTWETIGKEALQKTISTCHTNYCIWEHSDADDEDYFFAPRCRFYPHAKCKDRVINPKEKVVKYPVRRLRTQKASGSDNRFEVLYKLYLVGIKDSYLYETKDTSLPEDAPKDKRFQWSIKEGKIERKLYIEKFEKGIRYFTDGTVLDIEGLTYNGKPLSKKGEEE